METGDVSQETPTTFPERTARHTRDYQERKLRACGVDPALYGDTVETGLFGQDCFKAMTAGGVVLNGMVHKAQRFELYQATTLDQPLIQRGWIASDEEGPRGRRIVQIFEFFGDDGAVSARAEMFRLKPDPAKMGVSRGTRRASEDPSVGMALIDEKTMRPQDVTAFSEDVGNLIHFAPDFAARYGYRAPISQGIQTMIWMMGALAKVVAPTSLDVTARFARPVHWDDTVTLWSVGDGEVPDVLRAVNAEGKLAAELRVDQIEY
ncbi:MAG: MaoC family dehydratase [Alphaproteobacteria bacterium]|nr:MaoC family dehydratase [Alphaproteobacteria bacterium]